jgi:carboxylesterase
MTTIPKIIPGAEPFFFPANVNKAAAFKERVGCVCLHGLGASPQEVYWMGEALAAEGITTYGPRLFAQGSDYEMMYRARWQDWYLSALDAYHLLRSQCDWVFVAGLSMGGLCAMLLASQVKLDGVIGMGVALDITGDARISHRLRLVNTTIFKFDQATDRVHHRIRKLQEERGEPVTGRVAYYRYKPVMFSELLRMQAVVREQLPNIRIPVQLIFGEKDSAVPLSVMAEMKTLLTGSPRVEALSLPESDHILPNDVEMDRVFATSAAFIRGVVA